MNDKINSILQNVHHILDEYITIHDELIDAPKGIWGFIKGIFKPINFKLYINQLVEIKHKLEFSLSDLDKIDNHTLSEKDSEIQKVLFNYIQDLSTTVNKLIDINQKLAKKSDGNKYSMKDYRADMYKYRSLISSYTITGSKLNRTLLF